MIFISEREKVDDVFDICNYEKFTSTKCIYEENRMSFAGLINRDLFFNRTLCYVKHL